MNERLLRQPEVLARTGLSRSVLFELIKKGLFPKPVQLVGRTRAWVDSEITAWMTSRISSPPPKPSIRPKRMQPVEEFVPEAGLEPASLAAGVFETPASTDFATRAGAHSTRSHASRSPVDLFDDSFHVLRPSIGVDANWHVVNSLDTYTAHCFGFGHSVEEGEVYAQRIAACLNYCRGMTTDELRRMAQRQPSRRSR